MNPTQGINLIQAPVAPGSLLVALPSLVDPSFRQSVVLLCAVDHQGSMGLVINRPTNWLLADVLPDDGLTVGGNVAVFDGGPVADDRILILRKGGDLVADFTRVFGDTSLGGTLDALKEAATSRGIVGDFRPYRGYAGWGSGQLESEIEQQAWVVLPGNEEQVFDPNPHSLWNRAMAQLGGDLAIYATMPHDLSLN